MTATQRQSAEARLANAPPPAASPAGAHEHELRFRIDPAKVSVLLDLPLLKQAGPPRELELLNTYFDTAGFDLARAGCSLRIRHGQGRLQQTLKVPSRAGIAHGLKLELERVTATAKPVINGLEQEHLPRRLRSSLAQSALLPAYSTRYRRQVWTFNSGSSTIELVLDRGEISAGGLTAPICEVELELKHGVVLDLYGFAMDFCGKAALQHLPESKSARAVRLAQGRPPKPRLGKNLKLKKWMARSEAFRILARECVAHFSANVLAFAHGGSPRAVHQMRVALRRLSALAWAFKPMFGAETQMRLRELLSTMRKDVAAARAAHVFASELLPAMLARTRLKAGRSDVLARAAAEVERQHSSLRQNLESTGFAIQHLQLQALLIAGFDQVSTGVAGRDEARTLKAEAARRLGKLHKRILKSAQGQPAADTRRFHQLRLLFKKQRYLAAMMASLFGSKKVDRYTRVLAKLQDGFGAANDLVTSRRLVQDLAKAQGAGEGLANSAAAFMKWRKRSLVRQEQRIGRQLRKVKALKPFW